MKTAVLQIRIEPLLGRTKRQEMESFLVLFFSCLSGSLLSYGEFTKGNGHQLALAGALTNNFNLCGWPLQKLCLSEGESALLMKAESSSEIGEIYRRRSLAEGDSPSPAPPMKKQDHTARRWALGLALGIVAGALAAGLLATIIRLCVYFLHKPTQLDGPIIFQKEIEPKMLLFLEKEDALLESELIGSGGAGKVYKVQLEIGNRKKEVAVKAVLVKEDMKSEFGRRQIQAELETVGCIRHRNLTTLLAYVHRSDCHLLLYQYMQNGSLFDALRKVTAGELMMPWPIRHRIAVDTIGGLSYLHNDCHPKIIHRDLKPPNILLDEKYVAHLADFGLAKAMPGFDTHVSDSRVQGTVGYISPEYHQTLKFTVQSDVYSYGVVLANLLTGKDPTDQFFHTTGGSIGGWLRLLIQEGKLAEAIDPTLRNPEFDDEICLALKIAVFCTSDAPGDRPTSKDVKLMLLQIRIPEEVPPSPEAPASPEVTTLPPDV
ncbi:hypothetical protein R1sor_022135 [Riccia sorocarpa]|uniref:Protein kinase domain-containing protein n=1 Tax=Riccia sorocarpa TaxID=122646 RepID=A0ABD3GN95_9MARC